ncbi:hypothetical protein ALDI51_42290 [Alicycliphilus denitrificans]|uniref:hypothetical protein n=1 Tax=Alicycliphilus denitrificans TaxID=179636 RepID=UPI000A95DCC0|nr:hypothetical protein [Alicycliphilus denitrificans]MBN9575422.1 hypothetical protein [Alicycliphilus denitrificans]BCN40910.1 hypothetical protein ALDI51_42290 [Alicycliphilus denitrificans]
MTSAHTKSLVALLQKVEKDGVVPRGWDASLADRLRDLLRAHDSDLRAAALALRQSFQSHIAALDEAARNELLGTGVAGYRTGAQAAYRAGQLGFANLILAQAASKRVDQEFIDLLNSPTHRLCIEAMFHAERTTTELAKLSNKRMESVSRNLNTLRKAGIAEFRKVSTQTYNFLTPAAQQAFKVVLDAELKSLSEEMAPNLGEDTRAALASVMQKMPVRFQEPPNFSTNPLSGHRSVGGFVAA